MKDKLNGKTKTEKQNDEPAISYVCDDGTLIELIYDEEAGATAFAVWKDGAWSLEESFQSNAATLRPYGPSNSIIKHKVVLLPSTPEEYGDEDALIEEIEAFIHCYVDLTPEFTHLVCRYVLLTWLYDRFNELPYLRLRGDYGTGKTRFLLIIGSVCYKPIFANGASTVSPLFHLLDAFKGTLILDEADFRFSDEKADIVKILNAGNVRGIPILRTMMNKNREFDPRAFSVFGPKIIASRGKYEDQALESRCITEDAQRVAIRPEIPINLPSTYEAEALILRNKLLLYRFRNFHKTDILPDMINPSVENRINQIFMPLLSVTNDETVQDEMIERQNDGNARLVEERGNAIEAQVLEVIHNLQGDGAIRLKDIATAFRQRYREEFRSPVSSRFMGTIVRTKLHLRTNKSHGIYVISISEQQKLPALFKRYGIDFDGEMYTGLGIEIVPLEDSLSEDNSLDTIKF